MYQKIFQGGKRFRENCQMLKSDIYGLRDREIALQDFMQNFVDKQVMLQLAFELFSMADTIQAYIENLDFQQLIDNAPAADNGNFTPLVLVVLPAGHREGAGHKRENRHESR